MNIDIKGLSVNYVDINSNADEIVLILHGWGACIGSVNPIIQSLSDFKRVIALDLPGFGDSDIPNDIMNSYDYAEFVVEFINKLNIKNLSLIGHSFGGKVSAIIAAKYPFLVKKLVLVDAAGIRPERTAKYYMKVYTFKIKKFLYTKIFKYFISSDRVEAYLNKSGSEDYRNAQGVMRKILVTVVNEDIADIASAIDVPTLLIWGREDTATPLYMAEKYNSLILDSGLVILNGGHFSYLDDYNTFYNVIRVFV